MFTYIGSNVDLESEHHLIFIFKVVHDQLKVKAISQVNNKFSLVLDKDLFSNICLGNIHVQLQCGSTGK